MGETLFEKTFVTHVTSLYDNYNDYKLISKKDIDTISDSEDIFDSVEVYLPEPKKYNSFKLIKKIDGEKNFVENYGNPLATVELYRDKIKVEQNGDKTVIKVFSYSRVRIVGTKFFRVTTYVKYFGVNSRTANVYSGYISNYHKKRKFRKKILMNNFYESPCNDIKNYIRLKVSIKNFNKDHTPDIPCIAHEVINVFFKKLNIKRDSSLNLGDDDLIYKFYLDSNKIKYPNNFKSFRLINPSPKKTELKKFKNKYIDCFMYLYKLNGDKIKKILHIADKIYINSLLKSYKLFGKDYILSKDDLTIKKIIESTNYITNNNINLISQNKKDKDNAFEIFKLTLAGNINISTFSDHINFYHRLKSLENIKWRSNDYDSFLSEHLDWVERLDHYNKGNFVRIYSDEFKNGVETPILSKNGVVFPKLLIDSNEYNLESYEQSNCVKTYIKKENSIIISLRKGDVDSKDRATIEYVIIHDIDGVLSLNRIQSLGRFNNALDESWDYVLDVLDDRINKLVENNKFELPSATLDIGTRQFKTNLIVDKKNMYKYYSGFNSCVTYVLKWDKEEITKTNTVVHDLFDLF
jgi:hypothetical protein